MKFVRDIFTESDGKSFDIAASLAALAVLCAILFQGYVTYNSKTFDVLNFSTGIGALILSVGGTQKLKPQAIVNG
jgi:hypothetical protein